MTKTVTTDIPVAGGRSVREANVEAFLDAAERLLVREGAAGISTRQLAREAGQNHGLVHYYFGSVDELLLQTLERFTNRILDRQRAMYGTDAPFAEKWRTACDFLDVDIRSGYVRVLWELWAAGLADETLAAGWRSATAGWRNLLDSVFAEWADELGIDLPLRPRALATLVANVFQGIEIELLAGVPPDEAPHREVLDALGALIERAETRR